MILYFDTSAIAKYFHSEPGSAEIIHLVDDSNNTIWISELTITEFSSVCHRKFRMGEISADQLQMVLLAFEDKMQIWNIEPFSTLQTEEANRIINEYGKTIGIRTLDALQLAAFNLLMQGDWQFAVADKQLNNVATIAGVKTMFIQ